MTTRLRLDEEGNTHPLDDRELQKRRLELEALGGKWGRYADVDGDGIPWRTLPGTDHPDASYFTRGSGHDAYARYSERPEDYKALVDRLSKKYETARKYVPAPVVDRRGAKIGFIAYGTTDFPLQESRHQLRNERGVETDYLRLRALPFTHDLKGFVADHDRVYVVEQNRDGQMADLIRRLGFPVHLIDLSEFEKAEGGVTCLSLLIA